MRSALPSSLFNLLREASQIAEGMGGALYVVGGFVRDLLLEAPTLDLDLVVEGDAIRLARRLAEAHGGRVFSHARFGTAKWILPARRDGGQLEQELGVSHLDFATARRESYERPASLPQVERSSIRQDLGRRDFTINTLAIDLTPARWGRLLDLHGGAQDLEEGLIRVLHDQSFVDDPTRILRAVRLEQRLGFEIEERTEELLRNALDLLDHTTAERIRQEFCLILQEEKPGEIICRLQDLGVLRRLHPSLECDPWLRERFRRMRRVLEEGWPLAEEPVEAPDPTLYLALLTFRLSEDDLRAFMARLRIVSDEAKLLHQVHKLRKRLPSLREERQKPSTLVKWLEPASREALFVVWVAADSPLAREQIEAYDHTFRQVRPLLSGDDLKEMGLKPGPIFSSILSALHDARLDGEVTTLEEERKLVEKMSEERGGYNDKA
ncbi:MAG: hypothetical protein U9Q78_04600 [Chloroflexota bacterium]|nr:hypothetical protein [Chloroflexota bacterium]